ncbi:hypothetical protein ACFXOL_14755 [Streptomyces californicus]|uniref:hypothetical protein n=1 Tax=Streptomyces californicus TaxID=67351 RepID=UPI00364C33AE
MRTFIPTGGPDQHRSGPRHAYPFTVASFAADVAEILGTDWSAEPAKWDTEGILEGPYDGQFTFRVDWEADLCMQYVRLGAWPDDPALPDGFVAYRDTSDSYDGIFLDGASPGDNRQFLAEGFAAAVRAITNYHRPLTDDSGRQVTGADAATRALAARGLTVRTIVDAYQSWLVVGHDAATGAHALLHLYQADGDETDVDRVPDLDRDNWHAATVGADGTELLLTMQPAGELDACVDAIAAWVGAGRPDRNVPAEIRDLHGRFADGYTPEGIRAVFDRIYRAGGPYLVCVWEYADAHGFGGNSEFCAENDRGEHFEIDPEVHLWLRGQIELPTPIPTWVRGPVAGSADLPVSDDFHNYARTMRTG